MATIGVKVVGGLGRPGLLADVFKGAFGDPAQKAQLANISSEIWAREYANRANEQQAENYRQAAAKAAQETADLKARADAMDAAGPLAGENLASHEPIPVAIDPAPDEVKRLTGPTMPFIQPEAQRRYDTATAADRALGRLYVRDPNAAQAQQALQHQAGADLLVAGASDPAIVTPDQLRLGATLTGQMPTKDTVLTSADTAGVDMATRGNIATEAGKAAIDANKPAIVDIPGRGKVSLTPTGGGSGQIIPGTQPGLTKENAPQFLAALNAKAATNGGKLTDPADIALRDAAQQIMTKETIISRGKDDSLLVPGGAGQPLTQVAGPDPKAEPAYPGDSVAAADSNIALEVALDMAAHRPIDPAKAQKYVLAFDRMWPEKSQVIHNADGTTQMIDPTPAPAGWPTKEAVMAAASLQAQGGAASPGGAATPVPAEVARLGRVPAGMVAAPTLAEQTTGVLSPLAKGAPTVSVEQGRDQAFASMMQQPALDMNEIGINDLPSLAQAAQIIKDTAATNGTPSLFGAALDLASRDTLLDPASRAYEQAVALWTSDSLYKLSGAAISPPEWVRQQLAMVPMYGDTPDQLLKKARARSNFLRVTAKQGWFNDQASYKSFIDQTRLQGLELDYPVGGVPPIHGPAAGEPRIAKAPAAGAPGTPAATAPVDDRPAPKGRPPGYESLSDQQWAVAWKKLAPAIQARLRAQLGD